MKRATARLLVASASGLLFGIGLIVSGMTRPAKVIAFLDPLGAWDPSLAFVMAGAVAVYAAGMRWSKSRHAALAALAAPLLSAPPVSRIDRPLLVGSAIFGVGWGLGGYCPGPSLVALGSAGLGALVFVGFMLLGSLAAALFELHPGSARGRDAEVLQS
jgi:uncharacterized membrane protein YedE/YeeE